MNFNLVIKIWSQACHMQNKYFHIFHRYSNSLPDLLMVIYLIIEARMKLKRTKITENFAC